MGERPSTGRATDAIDLGAGALLMSSAFLAWVRRGPGSSLRGHQLADALLSLRHATPAAGALAVSALWYLIPLCGALTFLRFGVSSSRTAAAAVATIALVGAVLSGALMWWSIGLANAGLGFWAATVGGLGLAGSELGRRRSVRRRGARGTTIRIPLVQPAGGRSRPDIRRDVTV